MDLPRALSPWASYLTLFPRELALALGPLVQRLDLAVGPMRALFRPGSGDPEGFSGLTRRGPYERLLLSEWLLAEEAPDEFARRAAMGEHGFLEIAHRQAGGARACVVLLDGGPDQLGAPRIAHLAAMVVLARRAEVAGSRFQWGQLQDRDRSLCSLLDSSAVNWILGSRSVRQPSSADFAEWQDRLEAEKPVEDLWLIGGRRSAGFGRDTRASLLEIEDPYEPDTRSLAVAVRQPQYGTRQVTLDLPPEDECIRLLRDPFGTAVAPAQRAPSRYGSSSAMVWTPNSSKLLALANPQTLVCYALPNSPRAQSGKPKLLRPRSGQPIVGAGRFRKTTFAVTYGVVEQKLEIEPLTSRTGYLPNEQYATLLSEVPLWEAPKVGSELGHCLVELRSGAPYVDVLLHSRRHLIDLTPASFQGNSPQRCRPSVSGVLASAPTEIGCVYVQRYPGGYRRVYLRRDGHKEERLLQISGIAELGEGGKAFFGFGGGLADPEFGLVAVQSGPREWVIADRNTTNTFVPPQESEVVGVVLPGQNWNGPGLVVLEPGRRSLWVLGRERHHVLPPPSAEIAHVSVSPYSSLVGYTTVTGDVLVYSLYENTILYRLSSEEAAG